MAPASRSVDGPADPPFAEASPDAPWATVDLDTLRHNLTLLRSHAAGGVGRRGTGDTGSGPLLLAAVKADAYGHGMATVARALRTAGADAFGVATADEALALRAAGLDGMVLLFGPVRQRIPELVEAGVALTVAAPGDLTALEAAGAPGRAHVHLKVDTGMGRLGGSAHAGPALAAAVARSRAAELVGVWTHLATADEPDALDRDGRTERQLVAFRELLERLERHGLRPRWAHAANSAATLLRPDASFDLVRPGIALYGVAPSAWVARRVPGLRPALRWDAPVTFAKRVEAGTTIGYGATWTAARRTVVATVRVGYADGYPRSLSNRGRLGWRGRRVPVTGRVCMDQLMVDLGPDGEVEVGERVDVVGGAAPDAAEVAHEAGSFAYELLTRIGARVARRYVDAAER